MTTAIQFTLAQYDRMIQSGVLGDDHSRRVELVYGEVRKMPPSRPTHEDVVDLLADWSVRNTSRKRVRIRIQNSIGIPELASAPQPDVAWVKQKSYRDQRPAPDDVLLLIEVADSSLEYDRGEKLRLYAEAGIREYWVVNIPHFQVEVYREPRGREYRHKSVHGLDQEISPRALEDVKIAVASLFRS